MHLKEISALYSNLHERKFVYMILNEVKFKGSCPVELFNDLYELSQAGILNINNYEF